MSKGYSLRLVKAGSQKKAWNNTQCLKATHSGWLRPLHTSPWGAGPEVDQPPPARCTAVLCPVSLQQNAPVKKIALSVKKEKENGPDKILENSNCYKFTFIFSRPKFHEILSVFKNERTNSLKSKKINKVGSKYCQHVLACFKCVYVYVEGGGVCPLL